jgi:inositol transport system ATP-binding protein
VIYLSEERKAHGIFPNLSVRQNVAVGLLTALSSGGLMLDGREKQVTAAVMRRHAVKASPETKIVNLSGGNQQKILIGRSLEAAPRVLFLDEPTRCIDVHAKDEIYLLMQRVAEENRMGIVLISSEIEELLKCCNRVAVLYSGRKTTEIGESDLTMGTLLSAVIGTGQASGPQARASRPEGRD